MKPRLGALGLALFLVTSACTAPRIETPSATPTAAPPATSAPPAILAPTATPEARGEVVGLFFNVRPGHPFADPVVRRGILMCIDVEALVGAAQAATTRPTRRITTLLPTVAAAAIPGILPPAHDVEAALAALSRASWIRAPDGIHFKDALRLGGLAVVPAGPAFRWAFLSGAEAQLRPCGVALSEPTDYAGGLPVTTSRAEIGLMTWPATPDGLSRALGSQFGGVGKLEEVTNWSGWADPETDRLLDELGAASTDAAGASALAALQARLATALPVIPLWSEP